MRATFAVRASCAPPWLRVATTCAVGVGYLELGVAGAVCGGEKYEENVVDAAQLVAATIEMNTRGRLEASHATISEIHVKIIGITRNTYYE